MNIIYTTIETAIKSIPGVPFLATENVQYKPKLLTPWMRLTLLPAEPVQATIGYDRTLRVLGIAQLDYFTTANTGQNPTPDLIVSWFNDKTNRFLPNGILIDKAWRVTTIPNTEWFQTPIQIRYQTWTY